MRNCYYITTTDYQVPKSSGIHAENTNLVFIEKGK